MNVLDHVAIDRSSTAERVACALRDGLFDGRLAPGTPLREVDLATTLGVSRGTAREALQLLVSEGLLTRQPHRGVIVKALSAADVEDLFRARHVLEAGAAAAATPAGVAALRAAFAAYTSALQNDDPRTITDAHIAFHASLIGLAGSPRLSALGRSLLGDLRLAFATIERQQPDPLHELASHRRLLETIEVGDVTAALNEIRDHLDHGAEPLLHALLRSRPKKRSTE